MNRILIINIDTNLRSAYSSSVAIALKRKFKLAQITLITSIENEHFESIEIFENIHKIDTVKFLKKAQLYSRSTLEREIRNFLIPVINGKWDSVINLSGNRLGAIFNNLIKSKIKIGSTIDDDFINLKYDSLEAFSLSQFVDANVGIAHCKSIYRRLVSTYFSDLNFDDLYLHLESESINQKFNDLKHKLSRKHIILIDMDLIISKINDAAQFLIMLYKNLYSHHDFIPVLITSKLESSNYLPQTLREHLNGEIYLIEYKIKSVLPLLLGCKLLLTDNIYLKTLNEEIDGQTVLLSCEQNIDFSIIPKNGVFIYLPELNFEFCELIINILDEEILEVRKNISLNKNQFYIPSLKNSQSILKNDPRNPLFESYVKYILNYSYYHYLTTKTLEQSFLSVFNFSNIANNEKNIIKEAFNSFIFSLKNNQNVEMQLANEIDKLKSSSVLIFIGLSYHIDYKNNGESITTKQFLEITKELVSEVFSFLQQLTNLNTKDIAISKD